MASTKARLLKHDFPIHGFRGAFPYYITHIKDQEDKGDKPKIHWIRERPPGLIKHVLTVLVFWSWVLVVSRSLRFCP